MLKLVKYGDNSHTPKLGDRIELRNQIQEVVACQETGRLMLNIDADELAPGDLRFIKRLGLTISNPHTKDPVALGVEVQKKRKLSEALAEWLDNEDEDDDDDSSFFGSGGFLGKSTFNVGGFGGGFGGFGGGSFGGGGASRGF